MPLSNLGSSSKFECMHICICVHICVCVWHHRVHPAFTESTDSHPAFCCLLDLLHQSLHPFFVRLLSVLLFLLLKLPEMGLDGGSGLLNLDGAERRSNGRWTRPIAGVGVLSIHAYAVPPEAFKLFCFAAPPAVWHRVNLPRQRLRHHIRQRVLLPCKSYAYRFYDFDHHVHGC